jgi:hypothetical protein
LYNSISTLVYSGRATFIPLAIEFRVNLIIFIYLFIYLFIHLLSTDLSLTDNFNKTKGYILEVKIITKNKKK